MSLNRKLPFLSFFLSFLFFLPSFLKIFTFSSVEIDLEIIPEKHVFSKLLLRFSLFEFKLLLCEFSLAENSLSPLQLNFTFLRII